MVRFETDAGTLNTHQGHSFESPPCGAVFIQDEYDVDMYQFINSPPSMKKKSSTISLGVIFWSTKFGHIPNPSQPETY